MNSRLEILAKQDDVNHITMSSHDLIYLNLEQATLHLHPEELIGIAAFLQAASKKLDVERYCGTHKHFAMVCAGGTYLVWLMGLGLQISQPAFSELTNLANNAVEKLLQGRLPFIKGNICMPKTYHISRTTTAHQVLLCINWAQITLQLSPVHFVNLRSFLEQAQIGLQQDTYVDNGYFFIKRDKQHFYQVWLGNRGLYLSKDNFNQFVKTVQEANVQLNCFSQSKRPRLQLNNKSFLFGDN
ncbi:MAG: hypothetical protein AAF614_44120 [Chloroflexota bacterium]